MFEGKRVVAGEAILSEIATTERDQVAPRTDTLESLVRAYSRLVYRIAYAVLRCQQEAEDATQETFMRVLRYGSKLDQIQDPKNWLARIAWRVAIDRTKRRARHCEIPLEDSEGLTPEIASQALHADDAAYGTQLGSALKKLIAALPPKLREPLILSTLEEMSTRDVAATLGINDAAVRSRVFRARQILKEKLAQRAQRK